MSKTSILNVQGIQIALTTINEEDYISLTDMMKAKDGTFFVTDWLRNRNTLEYLGAWESMFNPNFNYGEFAIIKSSAGLNSFKISVKEWQERTNAIGIVAKAGRYGGTYAHRDIAFNFCMWISPVFQLYVVREYQRLIAAERSHLAITWDVKRLLSKNNYYIHTDAIKNVIIPKFNIDQMKQGLVYATEADILNMALFGCTAKQWQEANPELAKKMNIRDTASINQLMILTNLESLNAEMIKQNIPRTDRLAALHRVAEEQLVILEKNHADQNFRKLTGNSLAIEDQKEE